VLDDVCLLLAQHPKSNEESDDGTHVQLNMSMMKVFEAVCGEAEIRSPNTHFARGLTSRTCTPIVGTVLRLPNICWQYPAGGECSVASIKVGTK